ncbi:MAG: class I SAM-dependent methyltransferase [Bryobacteraceae bacterium]
MNADRIAAVYRWIEYAAFGRALEARRFATLDEAAGARSALILGEGDGRFVAELVRRQPAIRVDVVEASARMIALARQRVSESARERVRFVCQDALTEPLPQPGGYDLVVTNFFLDCFESREAAAVIAKCAAALEPGGRWLVGEFREPSRGVARLHARAWLAVMYLFFRWTTGLRPRRLPPWEDLLRSAGLVLVREQRARFGLLVSQVWAKPV